MIYHDNFPVLTQVVPHIFIVVFTYRFLASDIFVLIGGTIGSILVLVIVSIVCCIIVVTLGKRRKRQNVRSSNTQQFELQNIGSLETTTQTGPSKTLPDTTLNTIPERENLYSDYMIQPVLYPLVNCRLLQPYNESRNTIGPHEAQIEVPNPQQKTAPHQHQVGHHPLRQQAINRQKLNRSKQLNTSAPFTCFSTLPAHNPIVQESRQQDSNNWQAPSYVQAAFGNPIYEVVDDVHHSERDYYNIEEIYDEIKPLKTTPLPSYTDLFKN